MRSVGRTRKLLIALALAVRCMPTVELHPSGFTPPDSGISGWRGQGWAGVHSVCWPLARCGGSPGAPFSRILAGGWLNVCVTAFAHGCHVVFRLHASAPHGERGFPPHAVAGGRPVVLGAPLSPLARGPPDHAAAPLV